MLPESVLGEGPAAGGFQCRVWELNFSEIHWGEWMQQALGFAAVQA